MRSRPVVSRAVALTLAAGLLAAAPALAQKPVGIGTNPPGTAFYSVGSGVAKVVSDAGTVNVQRRARLLWEVRLLTKLDCPPELSHGAERAD